MKKIVAILSLLSLTSVYAQSYLPNAPSVRIYNTTPGGAVLGGVFGAINSARNNPAEPISSPVITPDVAGNIPGSVPSNMSGNTSATPGNTQSIPGTTTSNAVAVDGKKEEKSDVQDIGYNKMIEAELALKNKVKPTTGIEQINNDSLNYYTEMGRKRDQESLKQYYGVR